MDYSVTSSLRVWERGNCNVDTFVSPAIANNKLRRQVTGTLQKLARKLCGRQVSVEADVLPDDRVQFSIERMHQDCLSQAKDHNTTLRALGADLTRQALRINDLQVER